MAIVPIQMGFNFLYSFAHQYKILVVKLWGILRSLCLSGRGGTNVKRSTSSYCEQWQSEFISGCTRRCCETRESSFCDGDSSDGGQWRYQRQHTGHWHSFFHHFIISTASVDGVAGCRDRRKWGRERKDSRRNVGTGRRLPVSLWRDDRCPGKYIDRECVCRWRNRFKSLLEMESLATELSNINKDINWKVNITDFCSFKGAQTQFVRLDCRMIRFIFKKRWYLCITTQIGMSIGSGRFSSDHSCLLFVDPGHSENLVSKDNVQLYTLDQSLSVLFWWS